MEDYKKKYKGALERAKNYCKGYTLDVNPQAAMEYLFPELKESEDERIRKEIIGFICWAINRGSITEKQREKSDLWIAWLEKQDEKKPLDKVEPKFKVGDVIKNIDNGDTVKIEQILDNYYCYSGWDGAATIHSDFTISEQDNWELVEQKPTDKVEPKFKVGDWIASNSGLITGKIIDHTGTWFHYNTLFGIEQPLHQDNICKYHKWSIQDAKDGDVLYTHSFESDCVFLYQNTDEIEPNRNVAVAHCCIDVYANKIEFGIQGPDCIDVRNVKPATKEQRDLLFSKMKEAGYEWDAEKKELKKIEDGLENQEKQKPSNNDDAKIKFDYITPNPEFFQWIYDRLKYIYNENPNVDYMLSLKERIEDMQKPTWSEEDEEMFDAIIADIQFTQKAHTHDINQIVYEREIDWLKSLKERTKGE